MINMNNPYRIPGSRRAHPAERDGN
jgi:hypothetical protein